MTPSKDCTEINTVNRKTEWDYNYDATIQPKDHRTSWLSLMALTGHQQ